MSRPKVKGRRVMAQDAIGAPMLQASRLGQLRRKARQLVEAAALERQARMLFDEEHDVIPVLDHAYSDEAEAFFELLDLVHPKTKNHRSKKGGR